MSQNGNPVSGLFQNAVATGALSAGAQQVINIRDMGAQINAALGVSVDDIQSSEVFINSELLDDSSSIAQNRNVQNVRDGHNLIVEALQGSARKDGIITMCTTLNNGVLQPYVPIDQAIRLDDTNYNPSGVTPLYDKSIVILGAVVAKSQDFENNGVPVRTATLIVSDGADYGSKKRPDDVKKLVDDMLQSEKHIIAFMGIDDGHTDFRQVARDMGIRDEWILTPKNSAQEIRRAFGAFSQASKRASQAANAKAFSQTAMGGFGTP